MASQEVASLHTLFVLTVTLFESGESAWELSTKFVVETPQHWLTCSYGLALFQKNNVSLYLKVCLLGSQNEVALFIKFMEKCLVLIIVLIQYTTV